jgi:RNA polymerase sigma-32 factor
MALPIPPVSVPLGSAPRLRAVLPTEERTPRMDARTEQRLARRWLRKGDAAAFDALFQANMPLVRQVASRFKRMGLPLEDLHQEGALGLMEAIRRFDPERGLRLSTYAPYWIRAYLYEYTVRNRSLVRSGYGKHGQLFRLGAERRRLEAQLGEDHAGIDAMLAERLHLSEDRVRSLGRRLTLRDASLDVREHEDAPPPPILVDETFSPEAAAEASERDARVKVALAAVMHRLDPRERLILRERLMSDDEPSLAELGRRLGVSRERARQLEARVKSKLRGSLEPLALG